MKVYSVATFDEHGCGITCLLKSFDETVTEYNTLRNESPLFENMPEWKFSDMEHIQEVGFLWSDGLNSLNITMHEISIFVPSFTIDINNNI